MVPGVQGGSRGSSWFQGYKGVLGGARGSRGFQGMQDDFFVANVHFRLSIDTVDFILAI